jgi:hypothetical protein
MDDKQYLPKRETSSAARLWQLLQNLWQRVGSWMVYKSEFYLQRGDIANKDQYAHKARLYTYLPSEEEERDWLEDTHHTT